MVQSLYSKLYPPHLVAKQRVVERFDGDALDERWFQRNESGTGTSGMVDAVDEGAFVKSGVAGDSSLDFGGVRQYSPTGSVWIAVLKRLNSPGTLNAGLANGQTVPVKTDSLTINNNSGQTFYRLITKAISQTITNTDVNIDLIFHVIKGIMTSSSGRGYIDDILKGTITTNLPDANMCPHFTDSNEGESRCRYFEVYNT